MKQAIADSQDRQSQGQDGHGIECVNVQVGNKIDLSYAKIRQKYLDATRAGVYRAVPLSPPCSTFSRACWRNFKGPRPVRSFKLPRGLQVLTTVERRKCNLGNAFAEFAWEVVRAVADSDIIVVFLAFENPDSLWPQQRR